MAIKRKRTKQLTLTEEQWREITNLPEDREYYPLEGTFHGATHYPQTWVRSEFVLLATRRGVFKSEFRFGKWLPFTIVDGKQR